MNDGKLPIAPAGKKRSRPGGAALGELVCQSSLMAQAMDSTDAMVTLFSA